MTRRLVSIERIRSLSLVLLVFLHSAVYHYAGIFAVIDDPPPVVAVMGLLVLFGGAFIMMSGIVNTHTALCRRETGERSAGRICLDLVTTGCLLIVLHFLYDLLTGPGSFDWEAETRAISIMPVLLGAEGTFNPRRILEGSSLSTIGANLVLMGILLKLILRKRIIEKRLHYWILGAAALAFFSFAFFRYLYYPLAAQAREQGNWIGALFLGILLEKPYPVLPYFSFAVIGMIIAFALRERKARAILACLAAGGGLVIVVGAVFYVLTPPSLSSVTGSWFARVLIEAGLFLVVGSLSIRGVDLAVKASRTRAPRGSAKADAVFRSFGAAALSIFLLETPVSELAALLWDSAVPGWRDSIGIVMLYAACNAAFWVVVLVLWRKADYRFSLDALFARVQRALGRKTERTSLEYYAEAPKA